jgi:hypothetical protein
MSNDKKSKLDKLEELENEAKNGLKPIDQTINDQQARVQTREQEHANILDAYTPLLRFPFDTRCYPVSWKFAARKPLANEVANLSTIHPDDHLGMVIAIGDLIRKCIKIVDLDNNRVISSSQINPGHKTFFMLLLRDLYITGDGNKLKNIEMCPTCHEQQEVMLTPYSLRFNMMSDDLVSAYDGRVFTFDSSWFQDIGGEVITVHVPTLDIESRLMTYIINAKNNMGTDKEIKDKIIMNAIFDKKFLTVASFLYETGDETVKEIAVKFNKIKDNDKLYDAYLTIISGLKLDNHETITYKCHVDGCGTEGESRVKFPGWDKFFITTTKKSFTA